MGKTFQDPGKDDSRSGFGEYESLFQQASDPILVTDFSGNFIDANMSMCSMFGYTKSELLSMNISQLIDAVELERSPIRFDLLQAGQHLFTVRTMITKEGKRILVEANVKKFGEGMITAIVRDISQRRAMEESLARSEKNLRHVLASSAENFYMVDRNFTITLINKAAEKNLGKAWGRPVELGMNLLELLPDTAEPIKASFDKALAGEKVEYELHIAEPALPEWVLVSFMPVLDEQEQIIGVYVVTKDITEKKKTEQEKDRVLYLLNERVKELTTLYRFSQILQDPDLPAEKKMDELVAILPAGWQYPVIAAARIVLGGQEWRTPNFSPDAPHKQSAVFRSADGTEGMIQVVYLKPCPPEAEDAFFEEERSLINLLGGMFRVYLDRKEESETLIRSEANLNTIFNNTDSIYVLLDQEFRIISFNRPAIEFAVRELKHTPRVNDNMVDYFPADRQTNLLGYLKKALTGTQVSYETSYLQPDGNLNWYDVRIFPVSGDELTTFGVMCSLLDITDKKLLEEEILNHKVQEQKKITRAMINAQEKERNHIGQELHDNVNQILAGTKMFLTSAGQKDAKVKELIKYPLELIDSTINEIRLLSHRQVTPLRNVDLKELIQGLTIELNRNGIAEIDLQYSLAIPLDDDLKLVLYRIIQEQVTNILKHAAASKVMIRVEADTEQIHARVTDNGKGFDPAKKRKGIGIANMINRIESYNGEFSITSEPGRGCTVDVMITHPPPPEGRIR
ncbi:MAG: PAS domain S-box protein [Chitinophagaceae bacterium]|nr:PAS domain S-box protein [Chitinophagaceae bacterium]